MYFMLSFQTPADRKVLEELAEGSLGATAQTPPTATPPAQPQEVDADDLNFDLNDDDLLDDIDTQVSVT